MNIERLAFFITAVLFRPSDAEYPEGEYGKDYVYFMDDNKKPHYVNLLVTEDNLNSPSKFALSDSECEVRFWLYTKSNPTEYEELFVDDSKNKYIHYLPEKPLIVLIHGWITDGYSNSTQLIKNALLLEHSVNIIVADCPDLASLNFMTAATLSPIIGKKISSMILALARRYSFNGSNVHVIGHSLGAHVASYACKSLKKCNFTAARLTGLDPARPLFEFPPLLDGISAEDATFVDILHTDIGILGFEGPAGHIDFFPNGGYNQPGCNNVSDPDSCRHSRAYEYYAESIITKNKFKCWKCDCYKQYKEGKCSNNDIQYMGYYSRNTARGQYYGDTKARITELQSGHDLY